MDSINSYEGMKPVKAEVDGLVNEAIVQEHRRSLDLPVEDKAMHLVFSGPPGTGKTTIARDVGRMYYALGLLEKDPEKEGGFTEVRREHLVGAVMGETEEKTAKVFQEARGGVLFIDEAYSLYGGPQDMYGKQALETLMALAENHREDTVVIMAGYGQQMDEMFSANPGLPRRFPTTLHFTPYNVDERMKIMRKFMDKGEYTIGRGRSAEETRVAMRQAIMDTGEGNAGDVRNLWEKVRAAQFQRLAPSLDSMPEDKRRRAMTVITPSDVRLGHRMFVSSSRVKEPLRGTLVPTKRKRKAA